MAPKVTNSTARWLRLFRFPVRYPGTAVEIGPNYVAAVRVRKERGGRRVAGCSVVDLEGPAEAPLGPPRPAPSDAIQPALKHAIQKAGIKPGKASVLVPDSAARVWILQFPEIPRGHQAQLEMIRWKVKRSVPYRVDDGILDWEVLARPAGTKPAVILAALVPRTLVEQCERLLKSEGLRVGLVDLSSFNLLNAVRALPSMAGNGEQDTALLNATEGYFTLMIFRNSELIFYRSKTHAHGTEEVAEERARTIRRELATSLSYYTEKLKGVAIGRTLSRLADPALAEMEGALGDLGLGAVEPIDPEAIAALPIGLETRTAIRLLPAIGATLGRSG